LRRDDALPLAQKVCTALQPYCERIEIAGSIRRGKAEVHDVDVVAIPKAVDMPGGLVGLAHFTESQVWASLLSVALKKCGVLVAISGSELLRCVFADTGFQVDIHRARTEIWGVILLVRTGSRDHNIQLCALAKSKGLKLSAAEGVVTQEGFGKIIASRSEQEIFDALGLAFVEPQNREVF
jgi:DNA polymerase/3'-5' exonuclease PolX